MLNLHRVSWVRVGAALIGMVAQVVVAQAAEQIVTGTPSTSAVAKNDSFSVDFYYTTEPVNNALTGVGVYVYYDSRQVTAAAQPLTNVFSTALISQAVQDDSTDADNDSNTDKRILVAWSQLSSGWPAASLPLKVFTANFVATSSFSGTTFNIRESSVAADWTFRNATLQINEAVNQVPVVTAPQDITMEASANLTPVTLGSATATDAEDGTLTASADTSGPFSVGVHYVTWSATDSAGQVGTAVQTVTITDTTGPVVSVSDITREATASLTPVDLSAASASDSVDGVVSVTADNYGPFSVGRHTITWTAYDSAHNMGTATQTVTIQDTTAPVVTAPGNVTVNATGATTVVDLGTASASDAVGVTAGPTPDNSGPFAVGSYTVTWSASDAAGNAGTATQTVTVVDAGTPVVTPPADISVEATGPETTVSLGSAYATDQEDGTLTATPDQTGPFTVGEHTITWSAIDNSGNTGTATQLVTVVDSTAPAGLTAPADIQQEATGATTAVDLGTASATDLVDGTVAAVADDSGPFTVGSHTITWTVTDIAGNSATATQTVVITDTAAPTVTVTTPTVAVEATGATTVVALGTVTAVDTVDGSLAATPDDSGPFAVGTHTVTWSATDSHGNTGTATQTVIVSDTAAPTVTAAGDIAVEATGPTTAVTLDSVSAASASDVVDGSITPSPDQQGPFSVGVHTITWSATDSEGNTGTASQTVTVTDTTAPSGLVVPADINMEATAADTPVSLGSASASDLVDGTVTAVPDTSGPFAVGRHEITWTATDTAGNSVTATQSVTITDTTGPAITAPGTVTMEASGTLTQVDFGTATATDLVDGTVTVTPDSDGSFAVGSHTVTWTASDARGNVSTVEQTVVVKDSTAPAVTAPADITLEATAALTAADLGQATATDAVDGNLTATPSQTGPFAPGRYVITWSVQDSSGNLGSDTQVVDITDTTAPVVTAPADVSMNATGPTTAVDLGNAAASDAVGVVSGPSADNSGPFAVGTYTITWSASDAAGNTGTATQTITIVDASAPVVTAPADISTEATGPETAISLGAASATDQEDGTLTATPDQTGPFTVGEHTITWSATDNSGKTGTATQVVTVVDSTAPAGLTAPADIQQEATGPTTTVSLGTASATDLVDGTVAAVADDSGPFTVGSHTITWTATDAAGNSATATQTVIIVDTTAPTVTVATPTLTVEASGATTTVQFGTVTADDSVDGSLTVSPNDSGPFSVGTHTVTWSATDSHGNTGTAMQTVVITDTAGPTVTAAGNIEIEATGPTTAVSLDSVSAASATDLVDGSITPSPDQQGPFTVGVHTITWSATDSEGNSGTATQTVTVTDTTAPTVTAPANVMMNASGRLTAVALGSGSATDLVDGALTATADLSGPFLSGTHTITWSATDSAGNTGTATQMVSITPLVNFAVDQTVGEGASVTVRAVLSGPAAVYPVTVGYSIDAASTAVNPDDHDAAAGTITIPAGQLEAGTSFTVVSDGQAEGTETVVFDMGELQNAVAGVRTKHTVSIVEENVAPTVRLTVTQGGVAVSAIDPSGGDVTVKAVVRDPNPGDTHSFVWVPANALGVGTVASTATQFTFDPSVPSAGVYTVGVTVTDSGSPALSSATNVLIRVLAAAPTVAVTDVDEDGVADALDSDPVPETLPADGTRSLVTSAGLRLRLGTTAIAADSGGAEVTQNQLADYGGTGGAVATGSSDSGYESVGGLYDFEVSDLDVGDSAQIVIPLAQGVTIPSGAVYRKYSTSGGWQTFVEDGVNSVASAPKDSNGLCPDVGASGYTSGLNAGDGCIQLTIQDGGPNDADNEANGTVKDPGGLATAVPASGGGGGGASGPVALFLMMLGVAALRRRRRISL